MAKELKNLEKLQRLFNMMDEDALTKEQFASAFKKVVDFVKKIEQDNLTKMTDLRDLLEKARAELKEKTDSELTSTRETVSGELTRLINGLKKKEDEINRRLAEVRDGRDADEDMVVDRATERVKSELFIPTTEDLLNDVPTLAERIRDSLELLEGDDRLDASAIKGLDDLLSELESKTKQMVGAIHVPSPAGWTKHQSIALSSGTTVYSLDDAPGHQGKAAIVRYEGQVLTETTHYSISGTDVTLTFDPTNGTQLDVTYWPF